MKKILFILAVLLMLSSCASMNPFTDENPFIEAAAEDGKYLFTTTDTTSLLSLPVKISRISLSYDPQSEHLFGAVEGKFSKSVITAGINASGQFKKIKENGFTYWIHEESSIQITVPSSGLILFSTSDVKEVYDRFFDSDEKPSLDKKLVTRLMTSVNAVFVSKPEVFPDTDLDLSDATVSRFDSILMTGGVETYDTEFTLTTEEYASSFFKLLKGAYVSMLRKNGEKVDTSLLSEIITKEGNTVILKGQKTKESSLFKIFDKVI